jgi:putative AdoMet-dependent methyltransferase
MLPEGIPAPIPYPFPDEHRPYSSKLLAGKGFIFGKWNLGIDMYNHRMDNTDDQTFPVEDFDDWAETYDDSVLDAAFPFTGYVDLLKTILRLAEPRPGLKVLDLGTGTGNLALRFAHPGCALWCTDFSEAMLARAREKIPGAHFLLHDLRSDLPLRAELRFDRIVSAYVFHHFPLAEKVRILQGLLPRLAPAGTMLIGDIAFADQPALERVKSAAGDDWDDEYYWLADETLPRLHKAGMQAFFTPVSACAGIFSITDPQRQNLLKV